MPRSVVLRRGDVDPSQSPYARPHVVPERVALTRGRPDPEVAVVRRAPLLDDLLDLDQSILKGEATWGLLAPRARVAIDGDGERVAHPVSVVLRFGSPGTGGVAQSV